jgi:hypothetical protein
VYRRFGEVAVLSVAGCACFCDNRMLSSAHIAQSSHAAGAPLHYCCSKIHPRTPKLLATKAKQDSAPQFSAGSDSAGQQQLGQQEAGGPVPGEYMLWTLVTMHSSGHSGPRRCRTDATLYRLPLKLHGTRHIIHTVSCCRSL